MSADMKPNSKRTKLLEPEQGAVGALKEQSPAAGKTAQTPDVHLPNV